MHQAAASDNGFEQATVGVAVCLVMILPEWVRVRVVSLMLSVGGLWQEGHLA